MSDPNAESDGIQIYWLTNENEDTFAEIELPGSLHRLFEVSWELELVREEELIDRALDRFLYHLEVYYTRAYEVRDRALAALEGKGAPKAVRKAFKSAPPLELGAIVPPLSEDLAALLHTFSAALGEDIRHRNLNTHRQFFKFLWTVGSESMDLNEVRELMGTHPADFDELTPLFRRHLMSAIGEYQAKIQGIFHAGMALHGHLVRKPTP